MVGPPSRKQAFRALHAEAAPIFVSILERPGRKRSKIRAGPESQPAIRAEGAASAHAGGEPAPAGPGPPHGFRSPEPRAASRSFTSARSWGLPAARLAAMRSSIPMTLTVIDPHATRQRRGQASSKTAPGIDRRRSIRAGGVPKKTCRRRGTRRRTFPQPARRAGLGRRRQPGPGQPSSGCPARCQFRGPGPWCTAASRAWRPPSRRRRDTQPRSFRTP